MQRWVEEILNKIPSFTFKADLLHIHIEYIQQFFYRKDANFFTKTFFNSKKNCQKSTKTYYKIVPRKDFKCCTAMRRTVNLSSFRFMALHIGSIEDNSMMYAFILSRLRFSISLWFCLKIHEKTIQWTTKNFFYLSSQTLIKPFMHKIKKI